MFKAWNTIKLAQIAQRTPNSVQTLWSIRRSAVGDFTTLPKTQWGFYHGESSTAISKPSSESLLSWQFTEAANSKGNLISLFLYSIGYSRFTFSSFLKWTFDSIVWSPGSFWLPGSWVVYWKFGLGFQFLNGLFCVIQEYKD
jgi:hypothetical protein